MIEINEPQLMEALHICKESRKTNFIETYTNPWENPEYTPVKLLDFDEDTARINNNTDTLTVPVNMTLSKKETLIELGNYYGITCFLNKYQEMVDYSYLPMEGKQ